MKKGYQWHFELIPPSRVRIFHNFGILVGITKSLNLGLV